MSDLRVSLCIGVLLFPLVAGCGGKSGPLGRVSPPGASLVAKPGENVIHTYFTIHNDGGRDLHLHKPRSSCGCTTADLVDEVLPPGGSTRVSLSIKPPSGGTKRFEVRVPSDDEELIFKVAATGAKPVPYISLVPRGVNLGEARSSAMERTSDLIETREFARTSPWLKRVECDATGLTCAIDLENEVPVTDELLVRRYRLKTWFASRPEVGSVSGEIRIMNDDGVVASLSVRGEVLPPVFVRPSRLYARYGKSDRVERMRFTIYLDDATRILKAGVPKDDEASITPVKISEASGRVLYELMFNASAPPNIDTTLTIETDNEECPRVTLPVTILRDQGTY